MKELLFTGITVILKFLVVFLQKGYKILVTLGKYWTDFWKLIHSRVENKFFTGNFFVNFYIQGYVTKRKGEAFQQGFSYEISK